MAPSDRRNGTPSPLAGISPPPPPPPPSPPPPPADGPLAVTIVNAPTLPGVHDPEALLARFHALRDWAEALRAAGVDRVSVVQRFGRAVALRRQGVDYHFVVDGPADRPVGGAFRGDALAVQTAATSPNVVHVHGLVFPLLVRNLRIRLAHAPALLAQDHGGIHAGSPGFRRPTWRAFHRLGLSAADGFLFSTRALAGPWLQAEIIDARQPIYEIPESSTAMADIHAAAVTASASPALPGRPALLWVGRLNENKDPLTVLRGLAGAVAALPDAALTMAFGADDLRRAVEREVAASPALRGRVHLLGRVPRPRLPALYSAADLFLLGSGHESAGFALLEALAFGVTPIVTDIPAFRAFTNGGRVGALFPPGDAAALSGAIVRVAAGDPVERRAQTRRHFEQHLSWSAVGAQALAIYREAATRRRAAGTRSEAAQAASPRRPPPATRPPLRRPPVPSEPDRWTGVARYYDGIAEDYDGYMANPGNAEVRRRFQGLVTTLVPAGSLILDFGCGTGLDMPWYLSRGYTVIAYDVSAGMLEGLRRKHRAEIDAGRIIPWVADPLTFLAELPQRFSPAAVVSSFGPLNHIAELEPLFATFARALPAGGPVVAAVHSPFHVADMRRRWWWSAFLRGIPQRRVFFPHSALDNFRHYPSAIRRAAEPFFVPWPDSRLARALELPLALRQFMLLALERRGGPGAGIEPR